MNFYSKNELISKVKSVNVVGETGSILILDSEIEGETEEDHEPFKCLAEELDPQSSFYSKPILIERPEGWDKMTAEEAKQYVRDELTAVGARRHVEVQI